MNIYSSTYGSSYENMKKKFHRKENNLPISRAAQRVTPNSIVLEFGCASGYLTRYLSEEKHCEVYACEIDTSAAKSAAKYAKDIYVGDCESLEWTKIFGNYKFDFILFTDVLEHLRDPTTVLKNSLLLLKQEGVVCASIPNVAYKTVLIDLIKYDLFEYKPRGILDSTHLRFFTEKTIQSFFEVNGLDIEEFHHYKSSVVKNEKQLDEFPILFRWYLKKLNKNIETSVFYIEASKAINS